MKNLSARIQDLIERSSACQETARTIRQSSSTGAPEKSSAICARDSAAVQYQDATVDPETAGWAVDALFTYRERLAIAQDQGMDTSRGSVAERIARREARRIAAGIPGEIPSSRDGDLLDAAIEAFQPLGGLTFLRAEPRPPAQPLPTASSAGGGA